ncbi:hypothetical protein BgiMline_001534 [Biomphalaria glabrata]|uniref:Uncharacterized protein LOC106058540 isoform X1 n=1 Tax=Biomphalaria glabrata TaxID=6526 RepID=A0A2C9LER5_BIOGL|nr:uncharacterized protein LOC106058540 isoform X1 [Biomphalaria glabrata]KAI8769400.1 CAunnamed protein product [Biomphalaria glabrata]KAI8789733.1 CAunnamed protein product [Biomphalaria glabrata]
MIKNVFLFFFTITQVFHSCLCYPLHASCNVDWNFELSCEATSQKIINQIDAWKGDNCGTGEKCRYTFISFENSVLKATHTTPVKNYVDDLTFLFKPKSADGCLVNGNSRSETWYAVLDYGTNYCNLHNLITGSGLNETAGYREETENGRCTQYSSANCEKY